MLPDSLEQFKKAFASLPGIGPRQAVRIGYHLVNAGAEKIANLASALADLVELGNCAECFAAAPLNEKKICTICTSPRRARHIFAIVEKDTDRISLEQSQKFTGRYLVVGELGRTGTLSTMQRLRLTALGQLIKSLPQDPAPEIILATNPTPHGDMQTEAIKEILKDAPAKITRLGRGLPRGGEIEFADEDTLGGALDNRG